MKIDLHRHLEGSHTARALLAVARDLRIQDPLFQRANGEWRTEAQLAPALRMQGPAGDGGSFYAAIETARRAYVSVEAIGMLAYESFIDSLAEVDALEMRVSLFSMTRTLLGKEWREVPPVTFAEQSRVVLLALIAAKQRAEHATQKKLLLRLGLSRTFESEPHYFAMADVVAEHRTDLCGLDVLGILTSGDKEPLQPGLVAVIDKLRPALPDLTIHAGEFEDHRSIERALSLAPAAIGHGVHAVGSAAVMNRLTHDGVTLEVCPGSNALLIPHALARLRAEHGHEPILKTLQRHHVHSVLGSDDPVPMGTSFESEWKQAAMDGVDMALLERDTLRRWAQIESQA